MKNKFSTLLPTLKMNFDGPFPFDDPNAPKRPMNAYSSNQMPTGHVSRLRIQMPTLKNFQAL
jgi:hypothetical protein